VYYVRCSTRSSGASSKGTPEQAIRYITDAHDAERDPTYSHEELRYIARLDPGWKATLEGGRLPLVGLGALHGVSDQAALAREFAHACLPFHDRRGVTGYLSYTFTMPKEVSLLAEGHPREARQAMYAALQATLVAAFPGKRFKAVTTVHARNEAREVHYHAHVLIGKFAFDPVRRREYSLNSAAGGNTGKARVALLKNAWKEHLDAELKKRLGLAVAQAEPFGRPALTLPDGSYVPPLNRDSRRMLDKHLCFRYAEATETGAARTRVFRWTKLDETIYELASAKDGAGWSTDAFLELLPELRSRLKMYEARVRTLKAIGYLTETGQVTDAFSLHYRVHKGDDHPELQRLRADLHKMANRSDKPPPSGTGGGGPPGSVSPDRDVDLWLALHRHQTLIKRLERLGISPEEFKRLQSEARRHRPTPQVLAQLRAEVRREVATTLPPALPRTKGIIRAYWGMHRGRLVSYFLLTKGLLTLSPDTYNAIARRIREQAEFEYFYAREKKLALVGQRLSPLLWIGDMFMPAEVQRLRVAMERCQHLATMQRADEIFRERRAEVYREVRTAKLDELRAETQARAIERSPEVARQADRLRGEIAGTVASAQSRPLSGDAAAQLREGIGVLEAHRPEHSRQLAVWRGREEALLARLVEKLPDRHPTLGPELRKAAHLASWIGNLLAKERQARRGTVPPNLRSQERDIALANARFAAVGAPLPFPTAVLTSTPPAAISVAIATLRQRGFLTDGPDWSLRAAAAVEVSALVRKPLERIAEQDLDR
jgi:hypothetical protein